MRENYKRRAFERTWILACPIGHAKKVAVAESCEIARVAYLGQIINIGSGRAQKLPKGRSREDRDISMRDWACEKVVVPESCEIAPVV